MSLVSCTDCKLRLAVVETTHGADGRPESIVVALDYKPADDDAPPGLVDLRLAITGPASLLTVGLTPAVMNAGKELFVDPGTGRPFRTLADDTIQLLLFSTKNSTTIPGGRWLFLKLKLNPDAVGAAEPVAVRLVPREAMFAPPESDKSLWGSSLDTAIVVWPEVQDAP